MFVLRTILFLSPLALCMGEEPNPPEWPDSVMIFGPEDLEDPDWGSNATTAAEKEAQAQRKFKAESAIYNAWLKNGGQTRIVGEPTARYSPYRFWIAFKNGTYKNLHVPIGYYVHVAGIGQKPEDVVFVGGSGPHVPCHNRFPGPGQLVTFWRTAERFQRNGSMDWFVSQAAPIRDVIITEDLNLHAKGSYGSGGFLANSMVHGNVEGGGQQQWFTRNVEVGGEWRGVGYSTVFVGCTTRSNQRRMEMNTCGKPELGQTVVKKKTPLIAEKPFISTDPKDPSKFNLNVPKEEKEAVGPRWSTDNIVYGFEKVYVTKTDDKVQTMNAKLAAGLHLVITPAIYEFDEPLKIERDDQVVMCIGMASLVSTNGNALITVAPGLGGVRVAGCLLEASPKETKSLMTWGEEGNTESKNASYMHDLITRVGGPSFSGNTGAVATAEIQLSIHSNDVVADHLWLWRGDHYNNQVINTDATETDRIGITKLGELPNPHGLVVTADRVRVYNLAVEHATEDQVRWSGEDGEVYFFQCEIPYEVDSVWADKKFVSYRVLDNVKRHHSYGAGAYNYFNLHENIWMENAFKVPASVEKTFYQPFLVKLAGKPGGINFTINGKGPGVGLTGAVHERLYLNNECEPQEEPKEEPEEENSSLPWIVGGVIVVLILIGVGFMMCNSNQSPATGDGDAEMQKRLDN